jgi:uncharacterized membrane protein
VGVVRAVNRARLSLLGIGIIFMGFVVVASGASLGSGGSSSTGGFILMGPIPIVFGSGPNSGILATVALAITVVVVAFYLISFFLWRSGRRREDEAGAKPGVVLKLELARRCQGCAWALKGDPAEAAGIKEGKNKWMKFILNASRNKTVASFKGEGT